MISVIILTYNEELDIANCIRSVHWSDDIHVLDSGSTDNTIEIAGRYGATVSKNKFESFGRQRNHALDSLSIKNDWILFLDADEIATEEFHQEVLNAVTHAKENIAGFYCCWKMILEGKWLKYSDSFPKWQFRLLRKGFARFTDFGHGQKEGTINGELAYIREPYLHYGFSKGWSYWIERHNKYSTQEALARLTQCPAFKSIFDRHASVRNPALKAWLSRLPGWPVLRFLHGYLLNLGFLEGVQGFIYCSNMAYYEFLIQIKIRELKKQYLAQKTFDIGSA